MRKLFFVVVILSASIINANGQCSVNYSYSANDETLSFTNLSVVPNAHYYWNFGDGDGSNLINPVHVFPDDGKYLVTLYGLNTITQCVDVYEQWINVVKPDTLQCNIYFTDTVINNSLQAQNLSTNCSGLYLNCNVLGPGQWYCGPNYLDPGWGSSIFMHGMVACTSDSLHGWGMLKEYYKTVPFQFSSSLNYQNCSPNFETVIDYQPTGALVKLRSMNFLGADTFWITGFGNPIKLIGDTVSFFYTYNSNYKTTPNIIDYTKGDDANSCYVRGTQQLMIRNPNYILPPNCSINPQPVNQTIYSGSNAQFIIASSPDVTKQWQQDAGLGWVNLTNAGPYYGVNTDTLTIYNVHTTMNNYHFRCKVSFGQSGCHNTSEIAILYVPLGINDYEFNDLMIYPNPATTTLTIVGVTGSTIAEIFDISGKLLLSKQLNTNQLDISSLAKGLYFIKLSTAEGSVVRKFVKE